MDLPTIDMNWPPAPYDQIQKHYREYAAWYGGQPHILAAQYMGGQSIGETTFTPREAQYAGGLIGAIARFFWGTPPSRGSNTSAKLHIPLAEEVAAEGGYQMFKHPPQIDMGGTATGSVHQLRIEEYIENGLFVQLLHAAEVASALTGVFLRVGYNTMLSSFPLISVIHPDAALPTFSHGFLRDVILWRTVSDTRNEVVRHLEHHTIGQIEHGLYKGDRLRLGKRIELSQHAMTADLRSGPINTGLDILDCVYVPNLKTRIWRDNGQTSNLGRSDYGSILTVMDGLDEVYTSWMRDIRLGKARLMVPQGYLENHGRGQGATFDLDRDVFVELNALTGGDKLEIVPNQFTIRFEAHAATTAALLERCISGAGYSAQTFGVSPAIAMTATEVESREQRTFNTRAAKIEMGWKYGLRNLINLMLRTDELLGNLPMISVPLVLRIEFPPPVRENLKTLADTVKTLRDAQSASTAVLVKMIHPEWDDTMVNAEVALIGQSQVSVSAT